MAEIRAHKPAARMDGSIGSVTASETVKKKGLKSQSGSAEGVSPSPSSRSSRVARLTVPLHRLDDTAGLKPAAGMALDGPPLAVATHGAVLFGMSTTPAAFFREPITFAHVLNQESSNTRADQT